jgi:hypothetical protein
MYETPNKNVTPAGLSLEAMLANYDREVEVAKAVKKDASRMYLPSRALDGLMPASTMCGFEYCGVCAKEVTASPRCANGTYHVDLWARR